MKHKKIKQTLLECPGLQRSTSGPNWFSLHGTAIDIFVDGEKIRWASMSLDKWLSHEEALERILQHPLLSEETKTFFLFNLDIFS